MIVMVDEQSHQRLHGRIVAINNQPLERALVEIFDKPEYLLAPGDNSTAILSSEDLLLAGPVVMANSAFEISPLATTSSDPVLMELGM